MDSILNFIVEYLWLIFIILFVAMSFRKTKKKPQKQGQETLQSMPAQPPMASNQGMNWTNHAPWDTTANENDHPQSTPFSSQSAYKTISTTADETPYLTPQPIPNTPSPTMATQSPVTQRVASVAPLIRNSNDLRAAAQARHAPRPKQIVSCEPSIAAPLPPCPTPSSSLKLPPLTADKMAEAIVLAEIIGPPRAHARLERRR